MVISVRSTTAVKQLKAEIEGEAGRNIDIDTSCTENRSRYASRRLNLNFNRLALDIDNEGADF